MVRLRIKVDTLFFKFLKIDYLEKLCLKKKKIVVIKIIFWKSLQTEPNCI